MRHLLNRICGPLIRHQHCRLLKRTYLSSAFACNETWDSRLNGKILQQVNSEIMYYELDNAFTRAKKIAAVDVDVFVNAQTDELFLTEVEEFLCRLRTTEEAASLLPTTHHAVVRLFLKCRRHEDLIRILNDRLNYGIFPDYYCTLLLLDYFLKAGDLRSAAKIAALDMFQEDYNHDLVKYMSLFAIHKYILTDQVWEDPLPPPIEDDDDEEIKVRVPFLRNTFFDNHFDLTDGNHICGKSLLMISSKLQGPLRQSYKLMGLALFNLWDKLEQELINVIDLAKKQSELVLYNDALEFTRNFVKDTITDSDKLNKITEFLSQIDSKACIQEDLLTTVENEMKKLVEIQEEAVIEMQEKLYKEWETLREKTLANHLAEMDKRKRLQEITRKKEELQQREDLMSFFDNQEEIEKVAQEKEEKLRRRRRQSKDEESEEQYVPPEVRRAGNNTST